MAEAARAEVDADPEAVVGLVAEEVDVVVAGADGAELLRGEPGELALRLELGGADRVDHLVVGGAAVAAADAERDPREDLVHDAREVGRDVGVGQAGADRVVAAADVEADAGGADVVAVGDDAADRHGVAEVAVGAEDALGALLRRDARLELPDGLLVVVAEDAEGRLAGRRRAFPGGRGGLVGRLGGFGSAASPSRSRWIVPPRRARMRAGPRGSRSSAAAMRRASSSRAYAFSPPDGQPRAHHQCSVRPLRARSGSGSRRRGR